ncbi:MAG: hypothetical protein V3V08_20155 [Nannocystaceae bacterium]
MGAARQQVVENGEPARHDAPFPLRAACPNTDSPCRIAGESEVSRDDLDHTTTLFACDELRVETFLDVHGGRVNAFVDGYA